MSKKKNPYENSIPVLFVKKHIIYYYSFFWILLILYLLFT